MLHLHRKLRRLTVDSKISIVRLFIAIGLASIDTIWSLFMNELGFSDSTIGYISGALVLISVIVAIFSTPILEKYNQNKILIICIAVGILSYLTIGLFPSKTLFLIIVSILTIFSVYQTECFDIVFRDNTTKKKLNKEEGELYTLLNVGWLIGPIIAGYVMFKHNISSVFFVATTFLSIAIIILVLLHLREVHKQRKVLNRNIFHNIKDFFRNKKVHLPYILSAGIEVWWALIYIYVPLFMIKQGLPDILVGAFMAAIIIPLVLVEYFVGKNSEKKGFKPFFYWGYGILAMISIALFWLSNFIYIQLLLMIIASFFVGFLEPIQDTFFFDNVKKDEEEKYYPYYSTAAHTGGLVGKIAVATVILFLPTKYAYLAIGLFMAFFALASLRIKENKK